MKPIFLLSTLLASSVAICQPNDIFVVTDQKAGGTSWTMVRKTNLQHNEGTYHELLNNLTIDAPKTKMSEGNAGMVQARIGAANSLDNPQFPGIAALAYDRQHNRLYFSTMYGGDMRFINLASGQKDSYQSIGNIYNVLMPEGRKSPVSSQNQGPVITRMTQGNDGYIYGLSNDGEQFFKVGTHKNAGIEKLGRLIDDGDGSTVSVHASCTSWGGDLVAGADGNLYLFSMYQHAFKINPTTRMATYLGKVEGLPANFTLNGAAVDAEGQLILSSAAVSDQYAIVKDISNLKADMKLSSGWFNTSDLASGHLLFATNSVKNEFFTEPTGKLLADVFPNPVQNGQMIVHFKTGQVGKYGLDLLDVGGGSKMQSQVQLNGQAQRVTLRTASLAKGMYLLRILNADKMEVQTVKVLLQ